jgi:hypothetical protein
MRHDAKTFCSICIKLEQNGIARSLFLLELATFVHATVPLRDVRFRSG